MVEFLSKILLRALSAYGRNHCCCEPCAGKTAAAEPTDLRVGPFVVSPCPGTILPGEVQELTVLFHAELSQTYLETIKIHVSERDPADSPGGVPYELIGESCIPGIDAQNVDAIFEEYVISPSLDPFNPANMEFGRREGVFNFGAVLAQLNRKGVDDQVRAFI